MLGFKIFNNDPEELTNSLIALANEDGLALEVALYGTEIKEFTQRLLKNKLYVQNKNKSIHFNYRKSVVNNLKNENNYQNLMNEIEQAKSLLINRGVIHYQYVGNPETHLENFNLSAIKENLNILYKIAQQYNIIFYIENTYIYQRRYFLNQMIHQRIIWDTIIELNYQDYLGICLDWGHVKAFSGDSLTQWIEFVKELKSKHMPVYMHVHDNDGKKDLHHSFKTSEENNYYLFNNEKDKRYLHILKDIYQYFSNDSLILEYDAQIATEHYLWTKSKLF